MYPIDSNRFVSYYSVIQKKIDGKMWAFIHLCLHHTDVSVCNTLRVRRNKQIANCLELFPLLIEVCVTNVCVRLHRLHRSTKARSSN